MSNLRDIAPGSSIVATCWGEPNVHASLYIYFQDLSGGVREFKYIPYKWSGGTTYDVKFQAKRNSPLAIAQWMRDGKSCVRLYCLSNNDTLEEHCWEGSSWHAGSLTKHNFKLAAPNSKLAAVFCNGTRLYSQGSDNRICERRFQGEDQTWPSWSLPVFSSDILSGTSLAAVCYDDAGIRVYFQDVNGFIRELIFDQTWKEGTLKCQAKFYTPLSVVRQLGSIRLYFLSEDNTINEERLDGCNWSCVKINPEPIPAAPYTSLHALAWDHELRLYYQPAVDTATIQEYGCGASDFWFRFMRLQINESPTQYHPIDINGSQYPVGLLPHILDLRKHRSYDPSTISGVGVLLGRLNGELIGEEFTTKECKVLKPNTTDNSYTWVYAPKCAIIYMASGNDSRSRYNKGTQMVNGKAVACGGEFRVDALGGIESVVAITNGARGYKPDGGACLVDFARKLESLGIDTADIDWYWD